MQNAGSFFFKTKTSECLCLTSHQVKYHISGCHGICILLVSPIQTPHCHAVTQGNQELSWKKHLFQSTDMHPYSRLPKRVVSEKSQMQQCSDSGQVTSGAASGVAGKRLQGWKIAERFQTEIAFVYCHSCLQNPACWFMDCIYNIIWIVCLAVNCKQKRSLLSAT